LQLEPTRPYSDYITWLKRQDLSKAEAFWRKTLDGFTEPTPLATKSEETTGSPDQKDHYGEQKVCLPASTTATLQSLARQHRLTMNTIVQGMWALLLSGYSGEEDVVFGTTVSGRPADLAGIESTIGLFINTLPFRVKVAPKSPFLSWLKEVQRLHLELRRYGYCSAGQIHQWSQVPGTLPLYESILVFQNYPFDLSKLQSSNLTLNIRSRGAKTKHALTILISQGHELEIKLIYDDRRLERTTVSKILEHFQVLSGSIAADPAQQLATLLARMPIDQIPKARAIQQSDRQESKDALVTTRNPIEEILAGIWKTVLKFRDIDYTKRNFLSLGGHSLLTAQLVSRVRETFEVDMPLRTAFEAPTVAGMAERIEMARRGTSETPAPPIEPVSREGKLYLSFAQERLWVQEQLKAGNVPDGKRGPLAAIQRVLGRKDEKRTTKSNDVVMSPQDSPAPYPISFAVRLAGSLDVATLKQSLNEIVRRHEILRTTFSVVNGRPIQVIVPSLTLPLPVRDLSPLPEIEREAEVHRLAAEDAQQPFDLTHGPLLRTALLRLKDEEHVWLVNMHPLIADERSVEIFVQETAALYEAFSAEKPSPLPELPVQYADFAAWQREWLGSKGLEAQIAYWEKQLGHTPSLFHLPTDRPRTPAQSFRAACQSFALSESLTEQLRELSQQEGCTLFMTLLAAFKTLLHHYSGQSDVLVGTTVANRDRQVEGLIGMFANPTGLRTDLSGDISFRELLRRVRAVTLGAYAHQDLPFEVLVQRLPEWGSSPSSLFQVTFAFHDAPVKSLTLPGLHLSILKIDGKEKHDLKLHIENTEKGLKGEWQYNANLFDIATITRLAECFQTLLKAIVDDPEKGLQKYTSGNTR